MNATVTPIRNTSTASTSQPEPREVDVGLLELGQALSDLGRRLGVDSFYVAGLTQGLARLAEYEAVCPTCHAEFFRPCVKVKGRVGEPAEFTHQARRRSRRQRWLRYLAAGRTDDRQDQPPAASVEGLVDAWRSGYAEEFGSRLTNPDPFGITFDPHPAMLRRVRAVAEAVGADCDRRFWWVVAWHAARAAGRKGEWDFVPYLAPAAAPPPDSGPEVEQ